MKEQVDSLGTLLLLVCITIFVGACILAYFEEEEKQKPDRVHMLCFQGHRHFFFILEDRMSHFQTVLNGCKPGKDI